VTVKVLRPSATDAPQNLEASKEARAFLQQALYSSGTQRSKQMLQPAKVGGVFVYGPLIK
jgi:hypothetical protein